ncbi:MAG: tRNA (adenosine(37)-N6)-threonylcarbamoyltransferase complex transferase subunit TsaD, partial [Verrucomicrobiales bacterium]|nr:tRNA (adenosine(37)-N6)-threonylcarbamoyltransferase complex transferase subunit TsaD [Verrucomicrobiales bacterium]
TGRPYLAVNHMEGHLLSPFIGANGPVRPCIALIVSGGHTMLVKVRAVGDYQLLGRTRDDAAGEAFDKIAKMIGLPYPGGPEIDKSARTGNPKAFDFPRSFLDGRSLEFSFSGLKTAVLYELPKLDLTQPQIIADLSASVQEAIVEVLVEKLLLAAQVHQEKLITVSGGVSCNAHLRSRLQKGASKAGLELLLAEPALCTDNAGMIAFTAAQRFRQGHTSPIETDVDPNLSIISS